MIKPPPITDPNGFSVTMPLLPDVFSAVILLFTLIVKPVSVMLGAPVTVPVALTGPLINKAPLPASSVMIAGVAELSVTLIAPLTVMSPAPDAR